MSSSIPRCRAGRAMLVALAMPALLAAQAGGVGAAGGPPAGPAVGGVAFVPRAIVIRR